MLNRVQIIGHLGADVELRTTPGGIAVGDLRIATTERVKRDDQWTDEVEWHRVTVWAATAENCAKYLRKGSKVHVEGRIKTEVWEKDGEKRYTTKIIAQRVIFLDSKADREGRSEPNPGGYQGGGGNSGGYGGGGGGGGGGSGRTQAQKQADIDSDIPF